MKLIQKTILVSLIMAGVIGHANASSVTYDYVGSDFNKFIRLDPKTNTYAESNTLPYTIGPRLTGSATFANGITNPVTSFKLSDGKNTIDNMSANLAYFNMTFAGSDVKTWSIDLLDYNDNPNSVLQFYKVLTSDYYSNTNNRDQSNYDAYTIDGAFEVSDSADELGSPGSWTLQVNAVPVPAALPLMASAIGLFGFAKRRKQSV